MMRFPWLALAALGTVLAGCSSTSTCNRDADAIAVCTADGKSGQNTWFSSAYRNPATPLAPGETGYQYFPPARTITFHHNLGSTPVPQISLAFYENGTLAPTAGNQALIKCMDDQVIQLTNDTCSDFYIWVQTEGSGIPSDKVCDRDPADTCDVRAEDPSAESAGAGGS